MFSLNLRNNSGTFWRSIAFFGGDFINCLVVGFFCKRSNEIFCQLKCVATVSRIILPFFFPMIIRLKKGVKRFLLTPFPWLIFKDLIQSIKGLLAV